MLFSDLTKWFNKQLESHNVEFRWKNSEKVILPYVKKKKTQTDFQGEKFRKVSNVLLTVAK